MRRLPRHRRRVDPRRGRAGRRVQQRRRQCARPARRGGVFPRQRAQACLYRRRGAHAQQLGVQRPAEDPRRAAGAPHVHPRNDGAAQSPGDDLIPLPAAQLQAHPGRHDHRAPELRRAAGASGPAAGCGRAARPHGGRRYARRAHAARPVLRKRMHLDRCGHLRHRSCRKPAHGAAFAKRCRR